MRPKGEHRRCESIKPPTRGFSEDQEVDSVDIYHQLPGRPLLDLHHLA
jgi:hypothetical protein